MSFDLDDVLDLEENFHNEGYNKGLNEDTNHEYRDGKEYGYQISFQRFLMIGYYKSIIEHWLVVISNQEEQGPKINSTEKTLIMLLEQINNLSSENTQENGNLFDDLSKKLKLKMRLINITMSKIDCDRLKDMNKILEEFGGVLEIDNGDNKDDIDNGIW